MPRYFLEVSYKGTRYSGFQVQRNANTIQAEMEKSILVLLKEKIMLTGSSRTDAGVHARQNYFHFDTEKTLDSSAKELDVREFVYKMNAILPGDIVVNRVFRVPQTAHCRFDAVSREYHYYIYNRKNPFLADRAFYFPYKLNLDWMQEAAGIVTEYQDFTSFSKRNTQAKTFNCLVEESRWLDSGDSLHYYVRANRFLRGMVRGLTATMLKVGRGRITLEEFRKIIESKDCTKASFATPPQGLFLSAVNYPADYFSDMIS